MVRFSEEHELELEKAITQLKTEGYAVIKLRGKIPDAVAFKDGKFFPVELIGRRHKKNRGWMPQASKVSKARDYAHIGELLAFYFRFAEKDAEVEPINP